MRVRTSIAVAAGVSWLVFACGSGGGDPPGGASSSGITSSSSSGGTSTSSGGSSGGSSGASSGGSSGASDCAAICSTYASVTFDEDNGSDRLRGVNVQACHGAACALGTVQASDAGPAYKLDFTNEPQGVNVGATVTARPDGVLRFVIRWSFGEGSSSAAAAKDGDTFKVTGYFGGDGANTFEHTFTATYRDETECGTTCKVFETGP